ncbi:hypothetical protein [Paraburkholderia tropica]|uniref:Uncharacterized protein n=1 Tax=Paraburkholderia tropica TaxID=92647 RepID=A0AAQ1GJB0_9BURK|nr:hypothetical protein [Paraburkholderia tropica]RQN35031.1 hypothetical protein EHZ25_31885 [Paraburkholderia tropica]SEK02744.1 hypothetical protein SAMN05216550_113209 [Paraburkholderia tropica]
MSEQDGNKVVSGGLVVSMRPQISVELLADGEVMITTAGIADNFKDVQIDSVRFPVDCAKEIADQLYRLMGIRPAALDEDSPFA